MAKIGGNNYYVVQAFMVKDLKLKGLEKDIYAIIYGFSQSEGQSFKGSLKYLCDWTCSSKQGVINTLNKLIEKGLIEKKIIKDEKGVNSVEYQSTQLTRVVNSVDWKESTQLTGGGKLSLPNNINDNIKDNIIIKNTCDYNLSPLFDELWKLYPAKKKDVNYQQAFKLFSKVNNLIDEYPYMMTFVNNLVNTAPYYLPKIKSLLTNKPFTDHQRVGAVNSCYDIKNNKEITQQEFDALMDNLKL